MSYRMQNVGGQVLVHTAQTGGRPANSHKLHSGEWWRPGIRSATCSADLGVLYSSAKKSSKCTSSVQCAVRTWVQRHPRHETIALARLSRGSPANTQQ
eukprot:scaffold115485_cov20-Tisochrysis_lutea.AAC.3